MNNEKEIIARIERIEQALMLLAKLVDDGSREDVRYEVEKILKPEKNDNAQNNG